MSARVVIVGGGFGGLNAAKALADRSDLDLLILDRHNHHLFQPLLYQVAMAELNPADIAMPIRSIFRARKNVSVLLAEVTSVDLKANKLTSSIGEISYDYLVLACGAEHSYFGHDEWEDFAPGLKTLEQATEIRRRVLMAFERAEAKAGHSPTDPWLTFVIVGGGPTGVELAGALGEITRHTLSEEFRHFDPCRTRVILVEAGERILSSFPKELAERAVRDLRDLGVETLTGARVTRIDNDGVYLGDRLLSSKTVIWAAGVKPSPLNSQLDSPLDKQGRVTVTDRLSLPNYRNVFVIGDQAHVKDGQGNPLPGLASVAMQEGRFIAEQIEADLKGAPHSAQFHYRDKGQMATIGRKRAIAMTKHLKLRGLSAWLAWLLVHIYYLIGFKNRVFVLWSWMYSYLTYRRGARLIMNRDWHLNQR